MAIKNLHKFKDIENNMQKEALTNEVKGNLFEFLVAQYLARSFNIEAQYLKKCDPSMLSSFRQYETWLRKNHKDLLIYLPILAEQTARTISDHLDRHFKQTPKEIVTVGKIAAGFHNDEYGEADIIIVLEDRIVPISLKLCKNNAYLSTKSAGAKSFFSRYFEAFNDAAFYQTTFNSIIDKGFSEFGESLYERKGLEFSGSFDKQWIFGELPGKLKGEDKEELNSFYQIILKNLHEITMTLLKSDEDLFKKSLHPLMGYSSSNILQAVCYYKTKNKIPYQHERSFIHDPQEISSIIVDEYSDHKSSFNLRLDNNILQLRVKPMNKFTTKSYKINCSVLYQ